MISKPPPFKGLNIRIPIIIPIQGRGFNNQGSRLGPRVYNANSGGPNGKDGRLDMETGIIHLGCWGVELPKAWGKP